MHKLTLWNHSSCRGLGGGGRVPGGSGGGRVSRSYQSPSCPSGTWVLTLIPPKLTEKIHGSNTKINKNEQISKIEQLCFSPFWNWIFCIRVEFQSPHFCDLSAALVFWQSPRPPGESVKVHWSWRTSFSPSSILSIEESEFSRILPSSEFCWAWWLLIQQTNHDFVPFRFFASPAHRLTAADLGFLEASFRKQ